MKTSRFLDPRTAWNRKIKTFFMAQPFPHVILQVAATALSGISVSESEKKIKHRAFFTLTAGFLEPHFDKPNIKHAGSFAAVLKEGLARLHYSGEKVACLLPEACLKVFVFPFDSLPSSERERLALFMWRAKKQLPVLPEDVRLSYQIMKSNASVKVLLSLARTAVLQEYEDVFSQAGAKVGVITSPTLSLLNLVNWDEAKNFILVNIEEDSVGLAAATEADFTLFRVKAFSAPGSGLLQEKQALGNIVTEIENTVHFLEDREKRGLNVLWLRSRSAEFLNSVLPELESRLPFPVKLVDSPWLAGASPADRAVLAPLVGQL